MMTKRSNGRRTATKEQLLRLARRHQRTLLLIAAVAVLLIILVSSISSCSKKQKEEEALSALQNTVSQLQEENRRLQSELETQSVAAESYRKAQTDTVRVMDLFWQIDEAFVLNRHTRCRELIRLLESESLAAALPTESTTDNGRFSPYDRYAEICEALGEAYGSGVKQ